MIDRLRECYRLFKRRLYVSGTTERAVIDDFHRLYHQRGKINGTAWCATRWRGRPVAQNPMDLFAIARIIREQPHPVLVVEIGTGHGGSALFYADAGALAVATVDRIPCPKLGLTNVYPMTGDSCDRGLVASLTAWCIGNAACVVLDGDHRAATVSQELTLYAPMVRPGGYLIVCDTHFNGHPIDPAFGPGPWEAVEAWLPKHPEFVRDREVEPMLTFNPGGYLRRVR